jgi:RNA polymerase sigma factor (sigma-70 family)
MKMILHSLRRTMLRTAGAEVSDAQLLGDFLERGEEDAFAALLRRHGPMVMGVCRRLLRHHHDAEDAFQATFLVLARKARTIMPREMLSNWLYGVAYRTALEARRVCARHRAREQPVADPPERQGRGPEDMSDLRQILDRELSALPDRYRVLLVLCELEGKSRKEASQLLGLPAGTLSSRLARGKQLLAKRLRRHGLALSGGLAATLLCNGKALAHVPGALAASTAKAATLAAAGRAGAAGLVPTQVTALMEGVLKTMLLNKLTGTTALVLLAVLVAGLVAVGLPGLPAVSAARGQVAPGAGRQARDKAGAPKPRQKPAAVKLTPRQFAERLEWTLLDVDVDEQGHSTILVDDYPEFREQERKDFAKLKDDGQPISGRTRGARAPDGSLENRGLNLRLPVHPKARISLDGKESKLEDLKAGMAMSLALGKGGSTVVKIRAKSKLKGTKGAGPRWVIQEADDKAHTLSVTCEEDSVDVVGIPVAKDATILLTRFVKVGGGVFPRNDFGAFADLQVGCCVHLTLRSDRDKGIVVSKIQVSK